MSKAPDSHESGAYFYESNKKFTFRNLTRGRFFCNMCNKCNKIETQEVKWNFEV